MTPVRETRKTRIVCISDTHNQTPKLPQGDVLIHAGDLTKQGSRVELEKTLRWLEAADFEAKIVIAGNHDMTLDAAFFERHQTNAAGQTRWADTRSSADNKRMFTEATSITYLENEAATIYLNAKEGPHTCFKIYGSPYVPNNREWGFAYKPGAGRELWDAIPSDADMVVTHGPPLGHCDRAVHDDRTGCEELLRALHRVRPMLSVFGHIHEARGVERVRWNVDHDAAEDGDGDGDGCLTEGVEAWEDPGTTGKKQSLVNLSAKGGRPLDNHSSLARSTYTPTPVGGGLSDTAGAARVSGTGNASPSSSSSSSSPWPRGVAGEARAMGGGAIECRGQGVGEADVEAVGRRRRETAMVNASFLGPHHLKTTFNKPIVVDVDLPVW